MPASQFRIAVLVSGNGTNLQAIIDACEHGKLPKVQIALVLSDKPDAPALKRADKANLPHHSCDPDPYRQTDGKLDRQAFEKAMLTHLQKAKVDLLVLAGFMRVLSPQFVAQFPQKIINLHPALLPSFPGRNAIQQAWDYGVKVTGCTVHFVDSGVDSGPILLQTAVAMDPQDTYEALEQKIHVEEHRLIVEAIRLLSQKKITTVGRRITMA